MEGGNFGSFRNESSPTGKKRADDQNLCLKRERQLLRDVELFGGLHSCSVKALCDRKPDDYGRPNSALRKAVRNKVNKWKNLSPEAYQRRVVEAFGGNTASIQRLSDAPLSPPLAHSPQLAHSPPSRQAESAPFALQRMMRSPGGIVPYSTTPPSASSSLMIAMPGGTVTKEEMYIHEVLADSSRFVEIDVDIDRPERNREAIIFYFTGKKHEGKLHNGFSIQMSVDPRDARAGLYRAYLMAGSPHFVFIKAPGLSASFRVDHAEIKKRDRNACPRIQEAIDLNRNDVENDGKRVAQHFLLKFPSYLHLSNAIYSPDARGGRIQGVITPYPIKNEVGGKDNVNVMCRIAWRIHIVEATMRVVEEVNTEGKSEEDDMAEQLAGSGSNGLLADAMQTPHPIRLPPVPTVDIVNQAASATSSERNPFVVGGIVQVSSNTPTNTNGDAGVALIDTMMADFVQFPNKRPRESEEELRGDSGEFLVQRPRENDEKDDNYCPDRSGASGATHPPHPIHLPPAPPVDIVNQAAPATSPQINPFIVGSIIQDSSNARTNTNVDPDSALVDSVMAADYVEFPKKCPRESEEELRDYPEGSLVQHPRENDEKDDNYCLDCSGAGATKPSHSIHLPPVPTVDVVVDQAVCIATPPSFNLGGIVEGNIAFRSGDVDVTLDTVMMEHVQFPKKRPREFKEEQCCDREEPLLQRPRENEEEDDDYSSEEGDYFVVDDDFDEVDDNSL